ncbi:hypothetical protein CCACVL1_18228 [Corchorus capsularis]|uniref:RRM domain-containing protein n=1 Tax=Corchorus capsularis TaxID=210143 RepID=A0A1R3HLU4_COCAP|nr:hypothetical protein CCACVL1_18228 [Corchorus capsularis]
MRGRIMEDDDDDNDVHNGVVWMEEEAQTVARRTKGRGSKQGKKIREEEEEEKENFSRTPLSSPLRSAEGWIIIVSGVHKEAQEDDLYNVFADFGELKSLHLNLDRRTGYVKGYALIEFGNFQAAQTAISSLDGTRLFGQAISVDWAFKTAPSASRGRRIYPEEG